MKNSIIVQMVKNHNDTKQLKNILDDCCNLNYITNYKDTEYFEEFYNGEDIFYMSRRSILNHILYFPNYSFPIEAIQYLIEKGIDVNYLDGNGETPLMWICKNYYDIDNTHYEFNFEKSKSKVLIDLLINNNCDINKSNMDGFNPIISLINNDYIDVDEAIFEYLIKIGSNINCKLSNGYSFLEIVIIQNKMNKFEILKILLKYNINVNEYTDTHTPLSLLIKYSIDDEDIKNMFQLIVEKTSPNNIYQTIKIVKKENSKNYDVFLKLFKTTNKYKQTIDKFPHYLL